MVGAIPDGDGLDDERDLFEAARRGSVEALKKLIERLFEHLWCEREKQRKPRGLSPSDGLSDIVQHTLVQAQERFRQFKSDTFAEFCRWAGAIMLNRRLELTRTHQRRNSDDHRRKLWLALQDTDGRKRHLERPDDAVELREQAARADVLYQSLKGHERFIIHLRLIQGLPYEEIAAMIGKSSDAARKSYDRSIERLKQLFAAEA